MQAKVNLMTAAALIAFSSYAFAQSQQEHQEHHPGGAPTQAQPTQPSPPRQSVPAFAPRIARLFDNAQPHARP